MAVRNYRTGKAILSLNLDPFRHKLGENKRPSMIRLLLNLSS